MADVCLVLLFFRCLFACQIQRVLNQLENLFNMGCGSSSHCRTSSADEGLLLGARISNYVDDTRPAVDDAVAVCDDTLDQRKRVDEAPATPAAADILNTSSTPRNSQIDLLQSAVFSAVSGKSLRGSDAMLGDLNSPGNNGMRHGCHSPTSSMHGGVHESDRSELGKDVDVDDDDSHPRSHAECKSELPTESVKTAQKLFEAEDALRRHESRGRILNEPGVISCKIAMLAAVLKAKVALRGERCTGTCHDEVDCMTQMCRDRRVAAWLSHVDTHPLPIPDNTSD